jgi:hypothetical protein
MGFEDEEEEEEEDDDEGSAVWMELSELSASSISMVA